MGPGPEAVQAGAARVPGVTSCGGARRRAGSGRPAPTRCTAVLTCSRCCQSLGTSAVRRPALVLLRGRRRHRVPKPQASRLLAPSLPGRPALCEAHTCRLQRGFRGTGRGPATVPSSDAVTRPCRDHAPPPPACSVPRQPFAQRLACARAPWPEAGSVCLGLTLEGLSQGPLGSPAACPVIRRRVGSSSGRDICSWASVTATALPPWEGGTICRDGAIGPSALSGGRLTQLVWL